MRKLEMYVVGMPSRAPGENTMKKLGWNESQFTLRVLATVAVTSRPATKIVSLSPMTTPRSVAASVSIETSGSPA